jgi:NMD protein affecting ribosome stability and mRNA decay
MTNYCIRCGCETHSAEWDDDLCLDCFFEEPDLSDYEYEHLEDYAFADPGGHSALRAATPDNPRNLPCPECGEPNRLTPRDRDLHYVCDSCADRRERGY